MKANNNKQKLMIQKFLSLNNNKIRIKKQIMVKLFQVY